MPSLRSKMAATSSSLVDSRGVDRPIASRGAFSRRFAGKLALLVLSTIVATSCGAGRVNHFADFSQAGTAYVKALGALIDQAGASAIETDSLLLVTDRDVFPAGERGQQIVARDDAMRQRLVVLATLKRHAQLLGSYFEALGALAGSRAPSGIGTTAAGVVKSLDTLHASIEHAKVGNLAVSSFIGGAVEIAVAHFQSSALEHELKTNARPIERELNLQEAALRAVAEILRVDLQVQLNQAETRDIVLPFGGTSPLPPGWTQRRKDILQASLATGSASAAADAAASLKLSFVALAEGRTHRVDVPAMIGDINNVLGLIEQIKGLSPPK